MFCLYRIILVATASSHLATIGSGGSSGSTGSHWSLRSRSSSSTRVTTLSLREHTEGVSVLANVYDVHVCSIAYVPMQPAPM